MDKMMNSYEKAVKETYEKVPIHELINFDKKPKNPVKVSIVIPVCNVETYLRECLDSAVNQTLKDIEIICVNDGSTDSSLAILKEYAEKDERVKIISKDNAGYGHTMNIGMDMAAGEYIGILESDDYVKLDMYETLYNVAKSKNIDMVKADFYRFTMQDGYMHLFYNVLTNNPDLYNQIIYGADNIDMFKFTNTWSGIYKYEFLKSYNIRHQETPGASYQDNGFWFQTTAAASTIYYMDRPFYMNRRDNPNSSVYQIHKIDMANNEYAYIYRFLENHHELKEKHLKYYLVKKYDNYFYCYRQLDSLAKRDYIVKFSREFETPYYDGKIDSKLFSSLNYKRICEIVENPLGFYEKTKNLSDISFDAKKSSEKAIPIVFICDSGYVIPTATAISSLLKFKKEETIYDITIVAVNMSDIDIKKFSLIKKKNVTINIIYIEKNLFQNLHSKEITNYGVSTTALIKFLLPVLMNNYDKILYLDGDIIVKRDLSKLYTEKLDNLYAGVIRDIPQVLYKKQVFGIKYGKNYFNSGVMLLNVEQMRKDNITEKLIDTKKVLDSKLMDQDIFNEVFGENVKQLSIEYNTLYVNLIRSKGKYTIDEINKCYNTNYKNLEDIRRSSSIIHFCSKDKPWKYYDVPMADAWIEHFSRSIYADVKIERKSCLELRDHVDSNGIINKADITDKNIYPIVMHYDSKSTDEIVENIRQIKKILKSNEKCKIYLFYSSNYILPTQFLEEKMSINISLHYINIDKLLARDFEYTANGKLHPNYFRILAPEVLCQHEKILIINGAKIVHDFRSYFNNFNSDKVVNYIIDKNYTFWNSPVLIITTKIFIENITKFKFFDSFNNPKRGNFAFSKAFFDVVSRDESGIIDKYFFDIPQISEISTFKESNSESGKEFEEYLQSELKNKENNISALQKEILQLRESIEQIRAQNNQLQYELVLTRTSFSVRLGLLLTALPRKIFRRNKI